MRSAIVPILWLLAVAPVAVAAAGYAPLAAEQKAARQAGMPLTRAELKHRPIPAARNAAIELRQLNRLLKEKPIDQTTDETVARIATTQLSEAELIEVRQLLTSRRDVMDLVHAAAAKPACDFNRNWSQGAELLFPEYPTCREAVRLIRAESVLLALDGKVEQAVENQALGFRIARHSESDPCLIAYLVGLACRSISFSGLSAILNGSPPNAAAARKAAQLLEANAMPKRYQQLLRGEVVMATATLKKLRAGGFNSLASLAGDSTPFRELTPQEQRTFVHLIDVGEADCLALYRAAWKAAALPAEKRRKAMAALASRIQPDDSTVPHLLRTIFMPEFKAVDEKHLGLVAREAAFRAGAKVLEAGATGGQWPSELPAGSTDPFTAQSLGYHLEGTGFVIHSVGASGKFAGGKPETGEADRKAGEAFFRYAPPAAK